MRPTILHCPALGRLIFSGVAVVALASFTQSLAAQSPQASRTQSDHRLTPTVMAIRRASPAVVNIHGQKTIRATAAGMAGANGPDSFRQVNGMGTGVIIDPRGYVITNYHVVEDVDDILVTLSNGETTTADLVTARVRDDLALIKVKSNSPLPTIPRGTSSDLMVGESVIAIGNAYGYVHTSTKGIISALHRDVPVNETQEYRDLIQVSAGINPGNSGGPLLNIDGEIIGINVAVRVGAQQIAFAIPIDQVIEIVTEMIEDQNERRLATGLRTNGGPRDGDGVTLAHVSASSTAASGGLKPGDRVVRVGSQDVDDRLDFALALLGKTPGESIPFGLQRDGQSMEVAVSLESATDRRSESVESLAWSVIGIQARPVAESTIRRLNARMRTSNRGGLYITSVRAGSPADQQGLAAGDILIGIHGWQTNSMSDLAGILEHPDMQQAPKAKFYIVRKEQTLFGHLQIASQRDSARR
ncbi:Periplasmic serine endoprotease DegP precursor [Novipirellula aureliae]|uniref:Periplasmic serine endoprotease DegP n=1 Tax=Novipirellula aureliae TaxID=2527966 RepID=A0A5C6DXR0_9BACT|nr:trypsin-like peptidase domain-containing protein [Novipirellula aureliae]TWU41422.1 Periplasmic serine endoprotease DegP precursor [Novipirellula aureliae]